MLARTAVRLSDLTGARDMLAAAGRGIEALPGAAWLEAWLEQTRARLDDGMALAGARLTTTELRILRFLPTRLSFPEIVERVSVSANTVKTQANAVYRKLDVSCRSDAVSWTGQLGLLDA